MSNASGKQSPREKAKAAKKAADAAQKRRERLIRLLGAGAVLIVVAAIIVFSVMSSNKGGGGDGGDPNAALPSGVDATSYAYQVTGNPAAGIPLVQLWEDFQCPACKRFETTFRPSVDTWAAEGTINLQLRPTTFLDKKLQQSNDTSARATSAWGCAVDAGRPLEYHRAVFAIQPAVEGTPISQDQLIELGRTVGISDSSFDSFSSCVTSSKYLGWAANSTDVFFKDGVPGTPTIYVNGKELPMTGITSPQQLLEKIKATAG